MCWHFTQSANCKNLMLYESTDISSAVVTIQFFSAILKKHITGNSFEIQNGNLDWASWTLKTSNSHMQTKQSQINLHIAAVAIAPAVPTSPLIPLSHHENMPI